MELLPDLNTILLVVGVLYFWYAPLLLILSRVDLNLKQRFCWSCICLCCSWFSYFWLKKRYRLNTEENFTNY
ncbi:hypothetical protein [Rheinheimera sp.]|uniref:hypothetical protein n=1 Tax=Rheinheimera sp. TaxID=1869214 RepID=UPI002FDE6DA5